MQPPENVRADLSLPSETAQFSHFPLDDGDPNDRK
jgi:hypothetical protein